VESAGSNTAQFTVGSVGEFDTGINEASSESVGGGDGVGDGVCLTGLESLGDFLIDVGVFSSVLDDGGLDVELVVGLGWDEVNFDIVLLSVGDVTGESGAVGDTDFQHFSSGSAGDDTFNWTTGSGNWGDLDVGCGGSDNEESESGETKHGD